jgi:NTE family protein
VTIGRDRDYEIVLILSGGNALGAFQAGVYEALHEQNLLPDWIVGTSIGAINGALIAGSPNHLRVRALEDFWQRDPSGMADQFVQWLPETLETGRRTAAVNWTMMAGRHGLFAPDFLPTTSGRVSLFDTDMLAKTLDTMVDFDLLNSGKCRFTTTAVDLESGDDVVFDSPTCRIGADHLRASAALPVTFPPVRVGARWLVDGGLSANLPVDPFLGAPSKGPTLCVAVDLLRLEAARPGTIGEAAGRMQDLIFAAQSRRAIARWRDAYAGRDDISISMICLTYESQEREVAGKAMDFSGPTVRERWSAGYLSANKAIRKITDGTLKIGSIGFNIFN